MFTKSLAAAAVVLSLAGAAHAQYDESRIRSWDSPNQINVYAGWADFTITGLDGDRIVSPIPGVNGNFTTLRSSPLVREVVRHSGGQTSLRFRVFNMPGSCNQGIVCLLRGQTLIDADRIVFR